MPTRQIYNPNYDIESGTISALLGCVYALLLGALQTWPLQRTDVRGWLLSQPISRVRLFWTMTGAAASVYFLAMLPPFLVIYAVLHSYLPAMAPVDPRTFLAAAMVYLFAFVMHPGAVWMMSRTAHWVGSKTLVLALPVGVFLLLMGAVNAPVSVAWIAALLVLGGLGIGWVSVAACDAFASASNSPPRWNTSSLSATAVRRIASAAIISAVAIVVWTGSGSALGVVDQWLRPPRVVGQPYDALRFSPDGTAIRAEVKSKYDPRVGSEEIVVAAFDLPQTKAIDEVPSLRRSADQSEARAYADPLKDLTLGRSGSRFWYTRSFRMFQWTNDYELFSTSDATTWYSHSDGYLLGYVQDYQNSETPLLRMVCDRSGFGSTDVPFGSNDITQLSRHTKQPFSLARNEYLVDRDGVYRMNVTKQEFEVLLDQPLETVSLHENLAGHGWTLFVRNNLTVQLYDVMPKTTDAQLPSSPVGAPEGFTPSLVWPETRLELRQNFELPPDWHAFDGIADGWVDERIVDLGDQGFQLAVYRNAEVIKTIKINDQGLVGDTEIYVWPTLKPESMLQSVAIIFVPPAILMVAAGIGIWSWVTGTVLLAGTTLEALVILVLVLVHVTIAWAWTIQACRRRHLDAKESRRWRRASCLLGIVVPIVVLCLHESISAEECPKCGGKIRVDEPKCPGCGTPHATTPPRGIEIMAA